jgi:hypothetical protein
VNLVMDELLQLKPREESFYSIVFNKLPRLDIIVLCEGRTEVKVVKKSYSKDWANASVKYGYYGL